MRLEDIDWVSMWNETVGDHNGSFTGFMAVC